MIVMMRSAALKDSFSMEIYLEPDRLRRLAIRTVSRESVKYIELSHLSCFCRSAKVFDSRALNLEILEKSRS